MPLSCRFYAENFPAIEDAVMVNVRSIAEMGAYVHLLEYNNIEGMILLSELSRRRIRSVNKLIRVGRSECVVVIRVDEDKGYIDLSKRRVYTKDLIACEERFAKAKAVNSILKHVAEQLGYDSDQQLEDLYEKTAWRFDRKYKKKAVCYDIFKKAVTKLSPFKNKLVTVWAGLIKNDIKKHYASMDEMTKYVLVDFRDSTVLDECDIDEGTKQTLLEDIRKRLTPQAVKIRSDIEVSCFTYEGVDAVKTALIEGLKCSSEDLPIKINLIAPPQYVVTTNTLERAEGLAAVNAALERIRETIEGAGGNFKVSMAPKVVTDLDENEIKKRLELLELEGAEVSGDEEDNEEGMTAPAELDLQFDAEQKEKKPGDGADEEEDEVGDEEKAL